MMLSGTESGKGPGRLSGLASVNGSATTAALARGAAITVVGDADRYVLQARLQNVADVQLLKIVRIANVHIQHLIEVTVVNIALPVDAELIDAHQPLHVGDTESVLQQVHVIFKFALREQGAAKAGNGHIGYGKQLVELDIEFFGKKGFIVPLQTVLGWW